MALSEKTKMSYAPIVIEQTGTDLTNSDKCVMIIRWRKDALNARKLNRYLSFIEKLGLNVVMNHHVRFVAQKNQK